MSHILQEYAKSMIHKRLESLPEEKENGAHTAPPSQMQLEDQSGFPTDENASLPSLKTHNRPTVEATLKRIKQQVTSFVKY